MAQRIRYEDDQITVTDNRLTIRRYTMFGGDKVVPLDAVRRIVRHPLTGWNGRWRLQGSSDFRHWWNFDRTRRQKTEALFLNVGGWWRPAITPDDVDAAYAAIARHR